MIFDVDGLTSWLDFSILFIPEVRLLYQALAETKVLNKVSKSKGNNSDIQVSAGKKSGVYGEQRIANFKASKALKPFLRAVDR